MQPTALPLHAGCGYLRSANILHFNLNCAVFTNPFIAEPANYIVIGSSWIYQLFAVRTLIMCREPSLIWFISG